MKSSASVFSGQGNGFPEPFDALTFYSCASGASTRNTSQRWIPMSGTVFSARTSCGPKISGDL